MYRGGVVFVSVLGKEGSRKSCPIRTSVSMDIADERASQAHAPCQGSRKGYPYSTTKRLVKPVYSRGGACPRPGTAPTLAPALEQRPHLPPPWNSAHTCPRPGTAPTLKL